MSYILIDGKKTAEEIKSEIASEVQTIVSNGGKKPHLAAVLVGNDGASETYVASKAKACEIVGFNSTVIHLDESISENDLLKEVEALNKNTDIDGFIVQLPLPAHINEDKIIEAIDPKKDVDGFHPMNIGKMTLGMPGFVSATPQGILDLLQRYNIQTSGKHVVIIGRSNIVGKPLSILLSLKNKTGDATVTLCHSRTINIPEITKQADILIVAIGKKHFVTADMVKEGAVVIDVGIHREPSDKSKSGWKLSGDVHFDEVAQKSAYITPVPGGVGPMTIVSLLKNTLKASQQKLN